MISIGDAVLLNSNGASLKRQIEYASCFDSLDMIVFSLRSKNLKKKTYGNLTIHPTKSLNMFTFVYDVYKVANKIIKRKAVSVITTQDPFGTALAGLILRQRYKIPLHIQNHSSFVNNDLWISEKPFLFCFFNRLAHFTIRRADRLRVVNSAEKDIYVRELKINRNIIDICPVPVYIKYWQTTPSDKEILSFINRNNINTKKSILSWAGRASKVKNLPFLFESASKINSLIGIELLIAGNMNDYVDQLEGLKNTYDIKPVFLGNLTQDKLKTMYYTSDVYIHTSNYEGFGLVLCEAQACGTPVVTRNTAASKHILDDGYSGYVVDGDTQEFCDKVVLAINNNKDKRMGLYAQKMVREKFNKSNMSDAVIDSIRKTVVKVN